MKKIIIEKFIGCLSIFALVFTIIFPPISVTAKYDQSIRKDFPKQAELYNKNECEFQELNKKIHSKDLRAFLDKLKKTKGIVVPALAAIIYFSIAMTCNGKNTDIKDVSKHVAIATSVGVTSGILERLASYITDKYV